MMNERLINTLCRLKLAVQKRVVPNKGEGYVDTLIKILIAVVVGALLLTLLVALINALFPELQARIMDMFSTGGSTSAPTPSVT